MHGARPAMSYTRTYGKSINLSRLFVLPLHMSGACAGLHEAIAINTHSAATVHRSTDGRLSRATDCCSDLWSYHKTVFISYGNVYTVVDPRSLASVLGWTSSDFGLCAVLDESASPISFC